MPQGCYLKGVFLLFLLMNRFRLLLKMALQQRIVQHRLWECPSLRTGLECWGEGVTESRAGGSTASAPKRQKAHTNRIAPGLQLVVTQILQYESMVGIQGASSVRHDPNQNWDFISLNRRCGRDIFVHKAGKTADFFNKLRSSIFTAPASRT